MQTFLNSALLVAIFLSYSFCAKSQPIYYSVADNPYVLLQKKVRLCTIQKSIDNKSCELYKDTVYDKGVAKYIFKPVYESLIGLSCINLFDLKGNQLCHINFYSYYTHEGANFSKNITHVFWLKFKGISEDVRFIHKENENQSDSKINTKYCSEDNDALLKTYRDELDLINYFTNNDIISEKGLNKTKVEGFANKYKATKIICSIRNECRLKAYVTCRNKVGEALELNSIPIDGKEIAVALGDKLYAGFDRLLGDELEITKIIKSIVVSDKCKFTVQ